MKQMKKFDQFVVIVLMVILIVVVFLAIYFKNGKAATENLDDGLWLTTFNTFFLPSNLYPNWGQYTRAKLIGNADFMKGNDVVVLNELFDHESSKLLLQRLSSQYRFQTSVLGRSRTGWDETLGNYSSTAVEDGGVAVLSKYPIKERIQYIFRRGCGFDRFSNKGFVYTRIRVKDEDVHVIGTHTQSEDKDCGKGWDRVIRKEQMEEISRFIKNKHIPQHEQVYIAGDMNVNKFSTGGEYEDMLQTLNVTAPIYSGHPTTWDPETNMLAAYYYPKAPGEFLDYIFVEKNHKQPTKGSPVNTALKVKSAQWRVYAFPYWYSYSDYSDHYPVKVHSYNKNGYTGEQQ